MNDKLTLTLVTPERFVLQEEVDELIAPGVLGEFGILPNHTPFFTALSMGEFVFRKGNVYDYATIEYGFLEVNNNNIIILAENAELGREIDLEKAIEKKIEAEKKLQDVRKLDDTAIREAEIGLKKQLLRISIAEKYR